MRQTTHFLGQFLTAAGIWLLLSPFVLFNAASLSAGTSDQATLATMSMGFLALVVAGLNTRYHHWVRIGLGMALGIITVIDPWIFGFADMTVATTNAGIAGVAIVSVAIAELLTARHRRSYA